MQNFSVNCMECSQMRIREKKNCLACIEFVIHFRAFQEFLPSSILLLCQCGRNIPSHIPVLYKISSETLHSMRQDGQGLIYNLDRPVYQSEWRKRITPPLSTTLVRPEKKTTPFIFKRTHIYILYFQY